MNAQLLLAVILITAALAFYTIGVWAERIRRLLRPWHAVFFGLGLACDVGGTILMSGLPSSAPSDSVAGVLVTVMAVTGTIAIILMALHLVWAIVVLVRSRDAEKRGFHRYSIVVWAIWLVPYLAGAIGANLG